MRHQVSAATVPARRTFWVWLGGALSLAVAMGLGHAAEQRTPAVQLPVVEVTAVTATTGAVVPVALLPYPVLSLDAATLDPTRGLDLSAALARRYAGIGLNAVQGNPLQPDLQYRGFTASPLLGTPQGIAIYQDGVRLNEVFGDTVNWDLLPLRAIAEASLHAGADPVFGLNALGGALSLHSKDGFDAPGSRIAYESGSFGRDLASIESGGNDGHIGYYVLADHLYEHGWRDQSPTHAKHAVGTLSWRDERASLNLHLAQARTTLLGNGATPVELLAIHRRAIFTAPDETANRLGQASIDGSYRFDRDSVLSATVSSRRVRTFSYNGDGSDATACDDDATVRCDDDEDPVLDQHGRPLPLRYDAINNIGTRRQRALGANLQLSLGQPWWGRDNHFVAGLDLQRGAVDYRSLVEAAVLGADRRTSADSGLDIPAEALDLHGGTRSRAAYLSDTLSLSTRLAVTVSARYNQTRITLADRGGQDPDLDGQHGFSRLNPALGLSWAWSPTLRAYASYSESTRAPTPVELSCADELAPCRLPNEFVADPPLKQVVAKSWQLGLRGGDRPLSWRLDAFRTTNVDDILFQTTGGAQSNQGFFANVGDTRRQGLEASLESKVGRFDSYANYAWLDARYLDGFEETSANHPYADADGLIQVRRGARLPGLPRQQFKLGTDVTFGAAVTIGVDARYASGQYLRGDEANRLGQLGGYALFDLHANWRLSSRLTVYSRVENLFDRRYASFGVLGDPSQVLPWAHNPRFQGPGAPRAEWIGASYEF